MSLLDYLETQQMLDNIAIERGQYMYVYIKELESQLAEAKAENETLLWNLAGCSTFAVGYSINEPFDTKLARPAMHDVLTLAKKAARYREALENISVIGLRGRTIESIELVGSEHYEAAWLDCVEAAKTALSDDNPEKGISTL